MQNLSRVLVSKICSFFSIQEHFHTFSRINRECKSIAQSENQLSWPPSTSDEPHVCHKHVALGAIARGFRPQHLVLSGNLETKQDFKVLARASNLRLLKLSTSFRSRIFKTIAKAFPLLETLKFYSDKNYGETGNISKKQLFHLVKCKYLTDLDIRCLGELSNDAFGALDKFKNHDLLNLVFDFNDKVVTSQQEYQVYSAFAQRKMQLCSVNFFNRLPADILKQFPLENLSLFLDQRLIPSIRDIFAIHTLVELNLGTSPRLFSKSDLKCLSNMLGSKLERLRLDLDDALEDEDQDQDQKNYLVSQDLQELQHFTRLLGIEILVPEHWDLEFLSAISKLKRIKWFSFPSPEKNHKLNARHLELLGREFILQLEFLNLDHMWPLVGQELQLLNQFKNVTSLFMVRSSNIGVPLVQDVVKYVTELPIGCVMEVLATNANTDDQPNIYCIVYTTDGWKTSSGAQWQKEFDGKRGWDERQKLWPVVPIGDIEMFNL